MVPNEHEQAVATAAAQAGLEAVAAVEADLGPLEAAALRARLDRTRPALARALHAVFGAQAAELAGSTVRLAVAAAARRSPEAARLDRVREADPGWFLAQQQIGYVAYVDRFAGTLRGIADRLDHLQDLGVTYLHLMPLLEPREGDSDGGYAVADYRAVDPRLGTMEDLRALSTALHARGMALCIDLVLNHTAAEHPWARAAVAGELPDRYLSYPDRTEPDAYERTLLEIFPDTAPGSFTQEPSTGRWYWTTFHDWQWDLDHSSPGTFTAMLEVMLFLLEQGVDVLRLDAVPFLWKRLGGICQNEPEAHLLLQAFRALVAVAAPGALFKAEAIVGPDELVRYLGAHEVQRDECHLAYHNQLMVQLWSAVASRDVRLTNHALRRLDANPSGTGWVTYLRCHDDIGWAIADEDAIAVGLDPHAHRTFLADFYAGRFEGSFADGADFQRHPLTGDVRTSGTLASLCGLGRALDSEDPRLLAEAERRWAVLHSVLLAYPGIPLLFSGDEWALRNDEDWALAPGTGRDNRWMHRPHLPARPPDALAERCQSALTAMVAARRGCTALRGDGAVDVMESGDQAVLALWRTHPRALPLLAVANVAERAGLVDAAAMARLGPYEVVACSEEPTRLPDGAVMLQPLGWAWLSRTG